jgi:hypothetical protein
MYVVMTTSGFLHIELCIPSNLIKSLLNQFSLFPSYKITTLVAALFSYSKEKQQMCKHRRLSSYVHKRGTEQEHSRRPLTALTLTSEHFHTYTHDTRHQTRCLKIHTHPYSYSFLQTSTSHVAFTATIAFINTLQQSLALIRTEHRQQAECTPCV